MLCKKGHFKSKRFRFTFCTEKNNWLIYEAVGVTLTTSPVLNHSLSFGTYGPQRIIHQKMLCESHIHWFKTKQTTKKKNWGDLMEQERCDTSDEVLETECNDGSMYINLLMDRC